MKKIKTIYCDMDGVLTDCGRQYKEMFKVASPDFNEDFYNHTKKSINFWARMPWTIYGEQFWNFLVSVSFALNCKLVILSSPGKGLDSNVIKGKAVWVYKNIEETVYLESAIFDYDKSKYANDESLLIDDWEKNIVKWEKNNGIGFRYIDYSSAVVSLMDLVHKQIVGE